MTGRENITIAKTLAFDCYIYIWPSTSLKVKVKIMKISIAIIYKMVTEKASITIAIKLEVPYVFSIRIGRI